MSQKIKSRGSIQPVTSVTEGRRGECQLPLLSQLHYIDRSLPAVSQHSRGMSPCTLSSTLLSSDRHPASLGYHKASETDHTCVVLDSINCQSHPLQSPLNKHVCALLTYVMWCVIVHLHLARQQHQQHALQVASCAANSCVHRLCACVGNELYISVASCSSNAALGEYGGITAAGQISQLPVD